MTQKAKISVEIPNGWEIACSEMREPKKDEHFLDSSDLTNVIKALGDLLPGEKRVVVIRINPVQVGVHLPPGWRLADNIMRQPFRNEWYLHGNGMVYQQRTDGNAWVTDNCVIVQREGE